MSFQVVQVWLLSRQSGCVKHSGNCREGRASRGRARDVEAPVTRIQEQTVEVVKEIPQEIDVEKLMDEDIDEMILETDVGDVAWQNESESDAVTDRHGVPPEDVSTATVSKTKTVVKFMENGDFYSHESPVCVPEACDVRIELIPCDGSATVILKEIGGVCCLRDSS